MMQKPSAPCPPYLHLGCFDKILEGWLNCDITPHIRIARIPGLARLLHGLGLMTSDRLLQHDTGVFRTVQYLDVTRRFPFSDETFQAAYCSHLLEHLRPEGAEYCAREVRRVLKAGGVFRVCVPDLDKIIRDYDPLHSEDWCAKILESGQSRDKNRHHWMYNEHSLAALLQRAGFTRANRRKYREGDCPGIAEFEMRPDSLFMEAVK